MKVILSLRDDEEARAYLAHFNDQVENYSEYLKDFPVRDNSGEGRDKMKVELRLLRKL